MYTQVVSESKHHRLCDLLEDRRAGGSDLVWIVCHEYEFTRYRRSPNRSPEQIRNDVRKDPIIQDLVRQVDDGEQKLEKILDEMCHTFSLRAAKLVAFIVLRIMKSVYQHIWIDECMSIARMPGIYSHDSDSSTARLRDTLNKLVTESPVLYLPTHRSYADFVLLSYICFQKNLPLPTIASGIDFLSLNQVSYLLRSCGAFFIRRSFRESNDAMYPQVFRSYVQQLVLGGEMPLECFIEGTRSRSGKSLSPRIGLLRSVLHLFWSSLIPNLVLVPVSICYDRILEDDLYAKEISPPHIDPSSGSKPKETTTHLVSGARAILAQNYGSVYVRFGDPISLRDIGGQQNLRSTFSSLPNGYSPPASHEEVDFLNSLAHRVIKSHHEHSILSSFSIFSIVVFSDLIRKQDFEEFRPLDQDIDLSIVKVLTLMESTANLLPDSNLAHKILDDSLENSLRQSFGVHQNLVTLLDDNTLRIPCSGHLTLTKLRNYSNQFLQMVIEYAMVIYSPSYDFYMRLASLLETEFVLNSMSPQQFESLKHESSRTPEAVKALLSSQIDHLVVSYCKLVNWCLSHPFEPMERKFIAKQLQSDLNIPLDLVQNFIQLGTLRGSIGKAPQSRLAVCQQRMQSLSDLVISIVDGHSPLQTFCGLKPKL
ncbi:dihydroxyacetone phosphate acyltransferase-like [Brevipalpus obovatus]|uniref:dihydroxyacetone phosphate acyltransferase-like n=1 Tax=Brevipalpus obovatus TaxID=246614 RepID=UPI003D9F8029